MRRRFLVVSDHPEWGTRTDEVFTDAETREDVYLVWESVYPGIARQNEIKSIELKRRPVRGRVTKCSIEVPVQEDVSPDPEDLRKRVVWRDVGCGARVEAERVAAGFVECAACASDGRVRVSPALGGPAHFVPSGRPRIVTVDPVEPFDTGKPIFHKVTFVPVEPREPHAVFDYWCVERPFTPLPPRKQGFGDMRVATKGNIPDAPFDRPRRDNKGSFRAPTERDAVKSQRQRERNAEHRRRTMSGDRLA